LKTAGEFERIDIFLRAFQAAGGALSGPGVLLGPGDDAAVLAGGAPLAVTTDALMENVHFRRDWSSWEQVGHKALAVNLSDLAAMGARPLAFTCAVGLPATFGVADLEALARGMGALASRSGAILVGGNFTAAGEISITITAFGTTRHGRVTPSFSSAMSGRRPPSFAHFAPDSACRPGGARSSHRSRSPRG
jgi:thiamine-monophosphate kinase